jgi:hypothetical protein
MEKETEIGTNVTAQVEGNVLTLRIDLSKDLGPSKSGKTRMVATTSGNVKLPDGAKLGLNVYRS